MAFDPKSPKNRLVTLCGEPDWCLLLWRWDEFKILATEKINISQPPPDSVFQISMQNISTQSIVCVTGPSCYRYYQLNEDLSKFECHYSTLEVAGPNVPANVSDNYTCHTWIKDTARVVVCTDAGDILLTDAEGKFLAYIPESPRNNCRIESVTPAQHGLVVAGQNGWIWPYNSTTNESQYYNLQRRIGEEDKKDMDNFENITSMALSLNEDVLYYVTRHNQILKVPVSLDGAGKEGMP